MSQPWRELRVYFASLKFPQLSSCLETPAVTKVLCASWRTGPPRVLSLAALLLGLMAPAAMAQIVIIAPGGFNGAIEHMTLQKSLVVIHRVMTQCGWTC